LGKLRKIGAGADVQVQYDGVGVGNTMASHESGRSVQFAKEGKAPSSVDSDEIGPQVLPGVFASVTHTVLTAFQLDPMSLRFLTHLLRLRSRIFLFSFCGSFASGFRHVI
jgi:hypothetical protein